MLCGFNIRSVANVVIVTIMAREGYSQEPKSFDRIFGLGFEYNGGELVPEDGITLKHDTTNCSLTCFDWDREKVKWTKDLKPYGCRLLYFHNPEELKDKRYDVVIQFENKAGYLMRSRTG